MYLAIEMRLKTDFLLGIIVQPTSSKNPVTGIMTSRALRRSREKGRVTHEPLHPPKTFQELPSC